MSEKLEKGKEGEEYAISFLSEKGYRLIERNFTANHSEIDLIFAKEGLVVFVEVRLKATADYGFPEDSISKAKANAIKRGAEAYLRSRPAPENIRFDIVSITLYPKFEIVHFEDVFF